MLLYARSLAHFKSEERGLTMTSPARANNIILALVVFSAAASYSCFICGGSDDESKPAVTAPQPDPLPAPKAAPPKPPPAKTRKPASADPMVLGNLTNPCGSLKKCWLLSPSLDSEPVTVLTSKKGVPKKKHDHLMSGADFSLWQKYYKEIFHKKYVGLDDKAMDKKIARTQPWARGRHKKLSSTLFTAKGLIIAQAMDQGRIKDLRTGAERQAATKLSVSKAKELHRTLIKIARAGLKMTANPNAAGCMPLLRKYQPLAKQVRKELQETYKVELSSKYGYLVLAAANGVTCPVCLASGAFYCKQMLRYLKRKSIIID